MSTPHRCCICSRFIHREKGEREEFWRSRRCCSLPCRHEMRSRTQLAKAEARLAAAVASWRPGEAPSSHAQKFGVKHEKLRLALIAAGHTLAIGRARLEKPPQPVRRKGGPPIDHLLRRLEQVYGRRGPAVGVPLPARAA